MALLGCCLAAQAQVRYTDDPQTALNMDIEAKAEAAVLNIQTFSRTNQIMPDAYVVIRFMDGTEIKLTGRVNNSNRMHEGDVGHGFANRFNSNASLLLTPAQADLFKTGVKSLMIRMAPNAFYHEWEKDEIGGPLYARYTTSKENVMFKKKQTDKP